MPNRNNNGKGNQPYQPNPTPADQAAPPALSWPNDEARATVVATNQEAWRRHTEAARNRRDRSASLREELAALNAQFDAIRRQIDDKSAEINREDLSAQNEQATADGYALALTALRESIPGDVLVHPLNTGQGDPAAHAAVFGDPRLGGAFLDSEPHGYCVHCGLPAWRTAHTELTPNGATHGFGATCDPQDPNSKAARLSAEIQAARPIS